MAHGTPDWGISAGAVIIHQLQDMAELAARLGSIDSYDRRGTVIFLDDFAAGMNRWGTGIGGVGDVVDLSLVNNLTGMFSVRLLAASAVTPLAELVYELPKQVASRIGGEFAFSVDATTSIVEFELAQYDGTNVVRGQVRYSPVDETLVYLDSAGGYVTIKSGLQLLTEEHVFHRLKLVIDLENEEYVRVLLDDSAYSLSGVPLRVQASALLEEFAVLIWNRGRVGASDTVYVDSVIVTQNEPT